MSKRDETEWTSIPVMKVTVERLKKLGTLADTYDSVLRKILDEVEKK